MLLMSNKMIGYGTVFIATFTVSGSSAKKLQLTLYPFKASGRHLRVSLSQLKEALRVMRSVSVQVSRVL